MKHRLLCILVVLSLAVFFVKVDVFSQDCSGKSIETSAHRFITQYYKDLLVKREKSTIRQYYLEPLDIETLDILDRSDWAVSRKPRDEEDFEAIIQEGMLKKTEKFDFQEMKVISKKPLIIGIYVKEWNKSEPYSIRPFDENVFILKDLGECNWKIIDVISPYMP